MRIRYSHANEAPGQCLVLQKMLKMRSALFCSKKFEPIYTRHLYYNLPTQKVGMLVPLQRPSTKAHLGHLLAHRSATHELGSPEHEAILFLRVRAKLSRLQGHPIHALKINYLYPAIKLVQEIQGAASV